MWFRRLRCLSIRTVTPASVAAVLALAAMSPSLAWAAGWVGRSLPAPRGSADSVLMGVSCVSAQHCVAVGGPDDSPGAVLVERWNGTRWSIEAVRQPAGTEQGLLRAVSCTPSSACLAVGATRARTGAWSGLVERLAAGRWSFAAARKRAWWAASWLDAVSCTTPSACMAVGRYEDRAGVSFPLAERWDGSRWHIQPAGRIPYGELEGVSCTSADSCTAVGTDVSSQLIERWDGRRWSMVTAPGTGSDETSLRAISCTAGRACTAVGESVIVDVASFPLAERWNGITWSRQLPVRPQVGDLDGVSCGSQTSCTAVGAGELIERWNGQRWSVQQPANGTPEETLYGVSCLSAKVCTAVGSTIDSAGREVPLAQTLG